MNRLSEKIEFKNIDKKIIILFFNHIKESRFMKAKKQNTLTLIRKYDKFAFFITFTCNSHWKKFIDNFLVEVFIENRSKFCNKIFQLKLKNWWKIWRNDIYWSELWLIFMSLSFKRKIYFMRIYCSLTIVATMSRKKTLIMQSKLFFFQLLRRCVMTKLLMSEIVCIIRSKSKWYTRIVSTFSIQCVMTKMTNVQRTFLNVYVYN